MRLPQLFFALASLASAQDFATKADAYVQSWVRDRQFRGAVLVAQDGQPTFRKAYGKANDEWDIPNTPDTKFRLGSITKQFTAVAILQLAEKGKLKLDDPIKIYYPDAPAAWDRVTIHHLLNHTSGIPSYTDLPGFMAQRSQNPLKPAEIVKLTQNRPLEFQPGEGYKYNNTGYILLGVVIEKASGQSYATYIQKNLLEPLGMRDSGYDLSAPIIKKRASGYQPDGTNAPFIDMTLPYAAGSLYSTVDDLLKWEQAMYTEKLISKASFEKMTTPGKGEYGYGIVSQTLFGKKAHGHGGGINGFNTMMLRFPDQKVTTIVFANQNGPAAEQIARDLARLHFGEDVQPRPAYTEIKLPAKTIDSLAGRYQIAPNFVLKVWREGDQILTQATGQDIIEVFAKAENRLAAKVMEAELEFQRDADGKVTGLIIHQGGRTMPAKRLAD